MSRAAVLVLLCLVAPPAARAWEIADFSTDVTLHEDSTAIVTETIVADFEGESHHGIYRDIPVDYADRAGQHLTLRLAVQEVTNETGIPWRYRLEKTGRYCRIRVGNPDDWLTGRQTYRLVYEVRRGAVRFFPDHDESYWNLTGNEWAVPIRRVHATVSLPPSARDLRAVAYLGAYRSTEQARVQILGTQAVFDPQRVFGPYEGLTAVVGWGKGAVHPPAWWQVVRWWVQDNWVYGVPLLVAIVMGWLWSLVGRDPRTGRSQVVQYEAPEGVSPAEAGALIDQRVNLRDVTATVVDLAVRGYLRIEPCDRSLLGGSDYRLVNLKPWDGDPGLRPHERRLLQGLFGSPGHSERLSDLKYAFYEDLQEIRRTIYQGLVTARYFDSDPETTRSSFLWLGAMGGILQYLALAGTQRMHQVPSLALAASSALSAAIIMLFGQVMPRRTLKGADLTDRIGGFLEFLSRTDQDRIKRMNDPSLFERCLPYALAFGVAQQWARAFEGLYATAPSWYAGQWDTFSTRRLTRDLDHAMSSMGQSFAAVPRAEGGSSGSWGGSGFGGGGFSGGGGGGGGGGAW